VPSLSDRDKRITLVAAIMGSFIALLDGTVVNVALPAIRDDLGGGLSGQQWVVNAYLLFLGSLILIGGSLGDVFGEKRIFVIGVTGGMGLPSTPGSPLAPSPAVRSQPRSSTFDMGSASTAMEEPPAVVAFAATIENPSRRIGPPPLSRAAIVSGSPAITLLSTPGAQAPSGHARLPKSSSPPGMTTLSGYVSLQTNTRVAPFSPAASMALPSVR